MVPLIERVGTGPGAATVRRSIANKIGMEPMGALRTAVSALAVDAINPDDRSPEAEYRRAVHITASLPTIVAAYHRIRQGLYPLDPRNDLAHAANFLWMLTGENSHLFKL